jgi:hypothetical protein
VFEQLAVASPGSLQTSVVQELLSSHPASSKQAEQTPPWQVPSEHRTPAAAFWRPQVITPPASEQVVD